MDTNTARRTSTVMMVVYVAILVVSQVFSAPAQQSHNQPITGSQLHSIIVEIENALYKLKQLSNTLQLSSSKDAAMLGDAEPEFDLSDLERISAQQSSAGRARPKPSHTAVDQSQSIVGSQEDMPLEEALQYLMALAKERKVQRRDHDIPFPLTDKENNQ